jgi:ribosome-binding factor A
MRHSSTKGPSQRQLRVGETIRHALAEIMERGHFHDPVLMDARVTVSEVRISPDLQNATAFVMPLGGVDETVILEALNKAAPYFRSQIARAVELRRAPTIQFKRDESFDEASKIDRLLRSAPVARDLKPDAEEALDPPDGEET